MSDIEFLMIPLRPLKFKGGVNDITVLISNIRDDFMNASWQITAQKCGILYRESLILSNTS